MKKIIYVELLDEGTTVFRPVPSTKIKDGVYKLGGEDFYDPEDEKWEFEPESLVKVKEKSLSGEIVLVAHERFMSDSSDVAN